MVNSTELKAHERGIVFCLTIKDAETFHAQLPHSSLYQLSDVERSASVALFNGDCQWMVPRPDSAQGWTTRMSGRSSTSSEATALSTWRRKWEELVAEETTETASLWPVRKMPAAWQMT